MHSELPSSFSPPPFAKFYLHSIWKELKKKLTKKTTNSTIHIRNCYQALTSHDFATTHLHPMCTQNQSLDFMQITKFQKLIMPCIHDLITHKIRGYNYDSWRPNAHYSSLLFHTSNKNSCVAMNYAHIINLWTQD